MREIATKILDWILPERGIKRYLLEELRKEVDRLTEARREDYKEYGKMDERIHSLEKRFERESCLRLACRHRLTLSELPSPNCTDNGEAVFGADNPYRHDLPLEKRFGLSD